MESAITTKGQATTPKAIREYLGLKPGDRIKFFLHPNGGVVLLPKLPASAMRDIVKPRRGSVTIEEMEEAAASGAIEVARRRKRDDRARHQRPPPLPGPGRSGSSSEGDGNHRMPAQQ